MPSRQKEQFMFSAAGIVAIIGFSVLSVIVLEIYFTPLLLNACCGIGLTPLDVIDGAGNGAPGVLQITQLVAASEVHVGDVLVLQAQNAHQVVQVDELFGGIHFSTQVQAAGLAQDYSFMTANTDQLPVLITTLPWGAEIVSVAYSPQFQVFVVVVLLLVSLFLLVRYYSSLKNHPGEWDLSDE